MSLFFRVIRIYRRLGFSGVLRAFVQEFKSRSQARSTEALSLRQEAGLVLYKRLAGKVIGGAFQGMKLVLAKGTWSDADLVTYLLGCYELEVQEALIRASRDRRSFVDIGAGTGYFAVGAVHSGYFGQSLAFELDEENRRAIVQNALENGVKDAVHVFGKFSQDSADQLPAGGDVVCLVDIEGAEFEVFTHEIWNRFAETVLIIEIHDWTVPFDKVLALESLIRTSHEIEKLFSGARNPHHELLEEYVEDVRWNLVSEGRQKQGVWWLCTPAVKP